MPDDRSARAFKTAWFSKAARKARIRDSALLQAVREVMRGQADDLGGGVFKKRLNDNQHRSIVLAKGGKLWVFAFLYAKKDRANIDPEELAAFRKLAQAYARITPPELEQALDEGDLLELSDDH
jgi:hypothetical protein